MNHKFYMNRCLELAKKGEGYVAPNPMVGSVIVYQDKIIGEGYHKTFGESHAEVNAINSVKKKSLLKESSIYINLEPCTHFGKTPPCTDLIIRVGIPHVIIGVKDEHDKVAGKGIEKLKKSGIKVEVGVEQEKCIQLNKRFFKFHTQGLPFVILKWAESNDGFIARTDLDIKNGGSNKITGQKSNHYVHQQRANEQAILIGTNTLKIDNPSLTTRLAPGNSPVRVIISSDPIKGNKLNALKNDGVSTLLFNTKINSKKGNKEWIQFDGTLKSVLINLAEREIQSVIVEGGAIIINQFISEKLWDEAYSFIGDIKFINGKKAPKINKSPSLKKQFGSDKLLVYYNQ